MDHEACQDQVHDRHEDLGATERDAEIGWGNYFFCMRKLWKGWEIVFLDLFGVLYDETETNRVQYKGDDAFDLKKLFNSA